MKDQVLDLMLSRRTVHNYRKEPVDRHIIEDAVRVGIHAPNHRRTWPWRFYWLGLKARQNLALKNAKFASPGEILVLAISRSSDEVQAREDYASLACAVQNMSLYLHHLGYGSKWSTGKLMKTEGLYEVLGVAPNEIEICGIFWIGRPDESSAIETTPVRPELQQFLKQVD